MWAPGIRGVGETVGVAVVLQLAHEGAKEMTTDEIPSSDEIRAAMENLYSPVKRWIADSDPDMWSELAAHHEERAQTLAACVRELYEALDAGYEATRLAYNIAPDDYWFGHTQVEQVLDRYRAALEGGDDE